VRGAGDLRRISIGTGDEDYHPRVTQLHSVSTGRMPVEVPAIEINESVTVVFALQA
jgi:hypothetical protein